MDQKRKKHPVLACVIVIVLGLCCAAVALVVCVILPRYDLNETVTYTPTDEPLNNPLTGYAPNAADVNVCTDSRLVFIRLTWAEWEPTQGHYDVERLEEKFHIAQWKEENKHAVVRFMCDIPGQAEHLDIPRWLYDSTQDGGYYDIAAGKGYSPNYANPFFMERHALAIQALADYCNQDSFVSYVELGSLGHWGEWHTSKSQGVAPLPDAEVCRQYVLDYVGSFLNAKLMTRRNYTISVDEGLGVYNDMTGNTESTETWLKWLEEGGSYKTAGEPLTFTPVENFWEHAPVGGELTSTYSREELLGPRFSDTLETVEQGHMTFLGPNCPVREETGSPAAVQLRERLGYRLYISQLRTEYSLRDNCLNVYLTWNNEGLAPLYWDWPVTMYVYDLDGELVYQEELSELKLSALVPNEPITVQGQIPYTDTLLQGFRIGADITSPDGRDHVRLAMDSEACDDNIQVIYTYEG